LDDSKYVPFFAVVVAARMSNTPTNKALLETKDKNPELYKEFANLIVGTYQRMSCNVLY